MSSKNEVALNNTNKKYNQEYFTYQTYVILFLLGLIIIFLRSAYNITVPILYAEDGVWTSKIINNGLIDTIINARSDYFVSANVLMLYIAYILNKIFFGYNISNIPLFITFIQYIFYSLVALLPVIVFKKHMNRFILISIWLSILIIPLGTSGFEIFGKIVNIGYLFYFVVFCLIFYRVDNRSILSKKQIIVIDFILFISCTTNPACYILVFLGFILDIYNQRNDLILNKKTNSIEKIFQRFIKSFSNKSWIVLCLLCLLVILYHIFFQTSAFIDSSNKTRILWSAYLTHITIYPLVYPFYSNLNDTTALVLILLFIVYYMGAYLAADKNNRIVFIILFLSFLILAVITTYARPNIIVLYSYTNTFPDRYIYTINILFMVIFMYSLNIYYNKNKNTKIISIILLFLFIMLNILNIKTIIQYNDTIRNDTNQVKFIDRINKYIEKNGITNINSSANIEIDPQNWSIQLPSRYVICSYLRLKDIPKIINAANFSNDSWTKGVYNHNKGILIMKADYLYLMSNVRSIHIQGYKNYNAKILAVKKQGNYIYVFTDKQDASIFAYPAKIDYELK